MDLEAQKDKEIAIQQNLADQKLAIEKLYTMAFQKEIEKQKASVEDLIQAKQRLARAG